MTRQQGKEIVFWWSTDRPRNDGKGRKEKEPKSRLKPAPVECGEDKQEPSAANPRAGESSRNQQNGNSAARTWISWRGAHLLSQYSREKKGKRPWINGRGKEKKKSLAL